MSKNNYKSQIESQLQPPLENPNTPKSNNESLENTETTIMFKIILMGDSNTGKTSLIRRYVNNSFEDNYYCTIGVDFFLKFVTVKDTKIKLQIWDTAGMEKYRSLSISYIRGTFAAFVLFDLTSRLSFENVLNWVECYFKNCKSQYQKNVILIGNKADLVDQRAISKQEAEDFAKANNLIYWETSAKEGNNVEEVFGYVANFLYENYKDSFTENTTNVNFFKAGNSDNLLKKNDKKCC